MDVFISWSGLQSKAVAQALRDWLPNVIQTVHPFMSEEDIEKGTRWNSEIVNQLEKCKVGLVCLTPGNITEPWILFEAGALSRTVEKGFVWTYLFGLSPSDVQFPLGQFQHTEANKEDTLKLLRTINSALSEDEKLSEERINVAMEKWWPDLEEKLKEAPAEEEAPVPHRSEREILEEILNVVRELQRRDKITFRDWVLARKSLKSLQSFSPLAEVMRREDQLRSLHQDAPEPSGDRSIWEAGPEDNPTTPWEQDREE